MRIALYRGKGIVSNLILWQTRGEVSHAALVLPDNSVIESREFKGVQRRAHYRISGVKCYLFDVPTTPLQDMAIVAFAEEQLIMCKGWWCYDYLSIARFITRSDSDLYTRGHWFCSEFVFAAFKHAEIDLLARIQDWKVNPQHLFNSPLPKLISTT